MTFKEAREKLKKIPGEKARALQYEELFYSNGGVKCSCAVYVADEQWCYGKTWEEAFQKREEIVSPKPYTEEGQPE
ncbi:MAG: hypothetical protein WC836_22380 [Desulfobacula sp.]|jgi:hypothetical protein